MNIQNLVIEKVPAPSTDWKVFGDVLDDDGNLLGTFGPDGTSVNEWWVMQDQLFQYQTIQQFAVTMAFEIANGDAE